METLAAELFSNGNLAERNRSRRSTAATRRCQRRRSTVNAAAAARNAFFNGKRAEAARPVEPQQPGRIAVC